MNLDPKIALDIAQKTNTILGSKIFILNTSGEILFGETNLSNFKDYVSRIVDKKITIEAKEKNKKIIFAPIFYNKKVIGVFGLGNYVQKKDRNDVSLIQSLAEVLIYEKGIIDDLYSTTKTINEFISDLFLTKDYIKSFKEAKIQAEILGLDLKENQACLLIRIKELKENFYEKNPKLKAEEKSLVFKDHLTEIISFIKNIFPSDEKNIVGYFENDLFILIKEIKGNYQNRKFSNSVLKSSAQLLFSELNKRFKNKVTIGVGQFYPGLWGLRKSHHDAKIALEVGSKIWGHNKAYHIIDIGMFISLSNIDLQRKKELAFQIFSPLLTKKDLLKTAETFFDCGMNLTQAAKRLHLHRNTLVYRLLKIKKLLGLDPRNFYDAFQIKIGLIFTKEERSSEIIPKVPSLQP